MENFLQTLGMNRRLFSTDIPPAHLILLIVILLIAAIVDVRERRIPNWLIAAGLVTAIFFHAFAPQGEGAAFSMYGLCTGLVLLFPLYALGFSGAGDVKLLGVVGAFIGTPDVVGSILATFVAGGFLALSIAAYKQVLPQLLANMYMIFIRLTVRHMGGSHGDAMPIELSVGKMPYAVAILCGTTFYLVFLRS